MTDPFYGIRRTAPAPGGGLHAGMVSRLFDDLGIDFALGAGGAVHGHRQGAAAGARAIRQALEAAARGESLAEARTANPELAAALDQWPLPESPGS
jgi:2,3-diketo-5-methylthiopentyl-1-phosphate enolase